MLPNTGPLWTCRPVPWPGTMVMRRISTWSTTRGAGSCCSSTRVRLTGSAGAGAGAAAATGSPISVSVPSAGISSIARWVIALVSVAPCQCHSPAATRTVSPGWTSWAGPPRRCTYPVPSVTTRTWPSGCRCQRVRAPGANCTRSTRVRDGPSGTASDVIHALPEITSAGAAVEGGTGRTCTAGSSASVGGEQGQDAGNGLVERFGRVGGASQHVTALQDGDDGGGQG